MAFYLALFNISSANSEYKRQHPHHKRQQKARSYSPPWQRLVSSSSELRDSRRPKPVQLRSPRTPPNNNNSGQRNGAGHRNNRERATTTIDGAASTHNRVVARKQQQETTPLDDDTTADVSSLRSLGDCSATGADVATADDYRKLPKPKLLQQASRNGQEETVIVVTRENNGSTLQQSINNGRRDDLAQNSNGESTVTGSTATAVANCTELSEVLLTTEQQTIMQQIDNAKQQLKQCPKKVSFQKPSMHCRSSTVLLLQQHPSTAAAENMLINGNQPTSIDSNRSPKQTTMTNAAEQPGVKRRGSILKNNHNNRRHSDSTEEAKENIENCRQSTSQNQPRNIAGGKAHFVSYSKLPQSVSKSPRWNSEERSSSGPGEGIQRLKRMVRKLVEEGRRTRLLQALFDLAMSKETTTTVNVPVNTERTIVRNTYEVDARKQAATTADDKTSLNVTSIELDNTACASQLQSIESDELDSPTTDIKIAQENATNLIREEVLFSSLRTTQVQVQHCSFDSPASAHRIKFRSKATRRSFRRPKSQVVAASSAYDNLALDLFTNCSTSNAIAVDDTNIMRTTSSLLRRKSTSDRTKCVLRPSLTVKTKGIRSDKLRTSKALQQKPADDEMAAPGSSNNSKQMKQKHIGSDHLHKSGYPATPLPYYKSYSYRFNRQFPRGCDNFAFSDADSEAEQKFARN